MLCLTFHAHDNTLVPLSHAPLFSPYFGDLLRIWVNRGAGNKGPAIRGYYGCLMNCIPGFNTTLLKELLLKLQIPAFEDVPGLTMSEALDLG